MKAAFYGDCSREFLLRNKATVSVVSTWMSESLLDFVADPANATFGGRSGMDDDMYLAKASKTLRYKVQDTRNFI